MACCLLQERYCTRQPAAEKSHLFKQFRFEVVRLSMHTSSGGCSYGVFKPGTVAQALSTVSVRGRLGQVRRVMLLMFREQNLAVPLSLGLVT
jgi:uncharacterized protein (DUF2126 family)